MELQTSNNGGENLDSGIKTELQETFNGGTYGAHEPQSVFEDVDSACSTPYVSAPSSPGRGPVGGFYYSAPASPMHFAITKSSNSSSQFPSSKDSHSFSFEFEFSGRFGSNGSGSVGSMSSADELFLNGKIRPMKLSTHLEQPQVLAPLLDLEGEDEDDEGGEIVGYVRGRDLRLRDKSLRRRTRSMSPLRNTPVEWTENDDEDLNADGFLENDSGEGKTVKKIEEEGFMSSETTTPSVSASSSRSSSAGRNSKRWVFLKDFLYRSKSEGRSSNHKFWSNISFSSAKEKKPTASTSTSSSTSSSTKQKAMKPSAQKVKGGSGQVPAKKPATGKPTNGVGKRRIPPSPHELHYTKNRAQAEELRKKTFLPYRQGLLGCLGFSSKGYGAMNGFARALNSVSSRAMAHMLMGHCCVRATEEGPMLTYGSTRG
uniref:Calmodulin-binding protein n=1 Tax=Cucumis sativus TaxID=3659 RepID=A0A0A0LIY6_CUCSA